MGAKEGGCGVLAAALPPLPPPRAASMTLFAPSPHAATPSSPPPLAGWARCCYLSPQMQRGKAGLRCRLKVGRGNRSSVAQVECSPHLAPAWFSRLPKTVYKDSSSKGERKQIRFQAAARCCLVFRRCSAPAASTAAPLAQVPKGWCWRRGGVGCELTV